MLKIILARHAETIWNEQLRYIGRTDLELSKLGLRNAQKLADHLKETPLLAVFSSDMRRSYMTAKIAARPHKKKVIRERSLNEIDFGLWEGLTYDEIIAGYPDSSKKWFTDPAGVNLPAGELVSTFADRVVRGWRNVIRLSELLSKKAKGTDAIVLTVTHAGCIKAILGHILDMDPNRWWRIHQDKGALNYIGISNGEQVIIDINNTGYRNDDSNHAKRIKRCQKSDEPKIKFVLSKAAMIYMDILGPDFNYEQYMPINNLSDEMKKMSFYAIESGRILLGVIAYQPLGDVALVRHSYVLPACQRQGLGGLLLNHIESLAVKEGFSRILVGTYTKNKIAINFYKRHTFSEIKDQKALLKKYWDISESQAVASVVLEKKLRRDKQGEVKGSPEGKQTPDARSQRR